jgi:cytochrome c
MKQRKTIMINVSTFIAAAVMVWLFAGGPASAQEDTAAGQRQFQSRCASCHGVEAGQNRIGPHLADIVGRKAGTVEGARYSNALQSSDIVWDAQSLDAYLAAPAQRVPGTTMTVGVPDAQQRSEIVAYLGTLGGGSR